MGNVTIPKNYSSFLSLKETEAAIKTTKDFFEKTLAEELHLHRVSAPLFVPVETGLNDNLNGYETAVSFTIGDMNHEKMEIVHSLAKWKRLALKRYDYQIGEGIYTDMNAIRTGEELDNLHSVYVDQWDWEKIISSSERTEETLHQVVKSIYYAFQKTELHLAEIYPHLVPNLPEQITFVDSQELEFLYPQKTPKEREHAICEKYGAVFVKKIGKTLLSGKKHDGRAPDYDDWELNGDLLFWFPTLGQSVELSSMGIRVDKDALLSQLEKENCLDRLSFDFHKQLVEGSLPQTIGGGIGQSRICMFFLRKAHIGEVQSSVWPKEMLDSCKEHGISLL